MAKGKNAAALFEVIHADKRFGKKHTAARALSTPKWWFKGRDKSSAAVEPAAASSAPRDPNDPTQPAPRFDPTLHAAAPDPTAAAAAARTINVAVNPDRQEIAFKLTYTSAIVSVFALLVVLALVYLVGRRMSNGPTPVMANTAEILKGDVNPRVLEVGPSTAAPKPATAEATPTLPPLDAAPANPAPQSFTEDGPRIIGLNYMVVQSYPEQEKDLAEEAAAILKQNGVNCTIERGVSGWSSNWYNVVGTRGFDRLRNNPEYETYKSKIIQISDDQFTSRKGDGRKKFKGFEPLPLKWAERK